MTGFALQDIEKSYGANRVLNGISLSFERGQVTAIVGDNGAGKSTLLKVMAGVVSPDNGSLALDEEPISISNAREHRDRGIEMVYQDLALAKQHDAPTNLFWGRELTNCFGFLKRQEMLTRTREIVSTLGITIDDLSRAVGKLSGGQQQSLAIARALMFNPRVLLLDEPTAALAVREVEKVLQIVKDQKAHQRIVILVSHRLNDVFAVADRIVVMKQGRVVADLRTSETTLEQVVQRIVS